MGTADGHLYGFDGRTLKQSVKGHHGNVTTLHSCSEGIVSGGKDGFVKIWSHALEVKAEFDMSKLGTSVSPRVRAQLCAGGPRLPPIRRSRGPREAVAGMREALPLQVVFKAGEGAEWPPVRDDRVQRAQGS